MSVYPRKLLTKSFVFSVSTFVSCAANAATWSFAVSGDSRDCGNVVMPAIAADARQRNAAFYWHLGDLRAIYREDADFMAAARYALMTPKPSINDYLFTVWRDVDEHQIKPFGDMPFYMGIGNHETIPPKTRNQFLIEFSGLLDRPEIKQQRIADAALIHSEKLAAKMVRPRAYYRWIEHGVDFITLDNASDDAFDADQLTWFDAVVDADLKNPAIATLVVGMHEVLPFSKSEGHGMCDSISGRESGLRVYTKLLDVQHRHKNVYVLASHSHYFLADVFNTPHWQHGNKILPGWIVGTGGAERYPLPTGISQGANAHEHTYGYLLATVSDTGKIYFEFHELGTPELQAARPPDYTEEFVAQCVAGNSAIERLRADPVPPVLCDAPH